MKKSIFYFKQLTATEVGKTGTHEIYIRMPNDFDYKDFFQTNFDENAEGVVEKKFEAINLTKGHGSDQLVSLRFVYFKNSNKEKRIPSLGELFRKNDVKENDVVRLESRIVDNDVSYYITFLRPDEVQVNPKSFYYSISHESVLESKQANNRQLNLSSPLQQIFYGAPGTGKSHAVKVRTEGEIVIRTTFHPDSDYSTFVGAYKPTMKDGTWAERILSKDELTQELKSFRDSGITYESVKFGAKYSSSLSKLNSGYYKDMLNICDIPESKSVEITKGVEAGQYLKAEFSKNSKIAYSFVAQAFLQAYVAAWRRRVSDAENRAVYLVIEEINRGNCAQIFGDLFQLLDRDGSGFSEYPVTADADMRKYLSKELAGLSGENLQGVLPDDIIGKVLAGELLLLPDNMYIWATMNTSDQSLFPIDSAFKRRWDWTYVPIENADKGWKIAVGSERYDWWDFLQKINDKIGETTSSEDKKLGYFFCKAKDRMISADTFVSKVVFYLWNDVFKDYDPDESIFSDGKQGILTFNKFYESFGKVNDDAVRMMLTNLEVAEESGEKNTDDGQAEVAAEAE